MNPADTIRSGWCAAVASVMAAIPGIAVGVVAQPHGVRRHRRVRRDVDGRAVAVDADGDDPGREIAACVASSSDRSSEPVPDASTTTRAGAVGGTRSGCCTPHEPSRRLRRRLLAGRARVGRRRQQRNAPRGPRRRARALVLGAAVLPRHRLRFRRIGSTTSGSASVPPRVRGWRPAWPAWAVARFRRTSPPSAHRCRRTTGTRRARRWPGRLRRRRNCPAGRCPRTPSSAMAAAATAAATVTLASADSSGTGRSAHCCPTATPDAAATISSATQTGPEWRGRHRGQHGQRRNVAAEHRERAEGRQPDMGTGPDRHRGGAR